jgi:hypothetical protein
MYHPIVKELVLPGQQEGLQTIRNSSQFPLACQASIPAFNSGTPTKAMFIEAKSSPC